MMDIEQLITEVCSLPVEQRARVVECLLQSLSASHAESDRAWLSVAQGRRAELDAGQVAGIHRQNLDPGLRRGDDTSVVP